MRPVSMCPRSAALEELGGALLACLLLGACLLGCACMGSGF